MNNTPRLCALFLLVACASFADRAALQIPPLLEPTYSASGISTFFLEAREGESFFLPNKSTPTYGYNGAYLGPTIRLKTGQQVAINVRNSLLENTTVHWHGMHVPAEMDGGPHQVIEAGSEWKVEFPVLQEAATLWYHPHLLGKTGVQAYKGLAGLIIIDDKNAEGLAIPKEYGVDDLPIILQDRRFFENGEFAYAMSMPDVMHGILGSIMLANGIDSPYVDVPLKPVRFRILNGSDSSIYRITLSGSKAMIQIASDGGFLQKPAAMDYLVLSPGERAELIVDFSQYENQEAQHLIVEIYGGGTFEALELRPGGEPVASASLPETLNVISPLVNRDSQTTREFVMNTMGPGGQLSINGKKMDMDRIDQRVPLDALEVWEIKNSSMGMSVPHSFHVHDVQFQIVDINGQLPSASLSGWKDTVLVWPGDSVRIAARFSDYTGIYMYHCHLLVHEDQGMMGQFEVVIP